MTATKVRGVARRTADALDRPWHRPDRFRYVLARLRCFAKPPITVTEPPKDIVADRDSTVVTRDGTMLRVNVFRPHGATRYAHLLVPEIE